MARRYYIVGKLNREDGVGTLHAFAGEGSPKTEESVDSPKWPAEYIASQQVGLSLLCAFIESTPPSLIPAPAVRGLVQTLSSFGTLRLFREWAGPQRDYAEQEIDLRHATPWASTCNSRNQNGPNRPLQSGSTYWQSKANREETEWRVSFKESKLLSSIALNWHKQSLPARVTVLLSNDFGKNFNEVASHFVPPIDSAEMYIALELPLHATHLSFQFDKFAKCNEPDNRNKERFHKLERVRLFSPLQNMTNISTRKLCHRLSNWLLSVAASPRNQNPAVASTFDGILNKSHEEPFTVGVEDEIALLEARLEVLRKRRVTTADAPEALEEKLGTTGSSLHGQVVSVENGSSSDLALGALQLLALSSGSLDVTLSFRNSFSQDALCLQNLN